MQDAIFAAIGAALGVVKDLGLGIVNLLGKSKPDVTEIERMRLEYEKAVAGLDNLIKQGALEIQKKLIELEAQTGARWRTPLILASGVALIAAALNNILAACYVAAARPVDMTSAPVIVLAGMFVLLVTGDISLFKSLFNREKKP